MKIKVTDLKKQLKGYDQKELIELVIDLFKTHKEVQNSLSSKFLGDEVNEALYQEARKKIENEFFPDRGVPKLRLGEAKKVITSFKKATNDETRTVDIMLFYVEQGVEFTNTYGDINESFYGSIARMFDQAVMECDRNEELYRTFSRRLREIVSEAQGIGWGFGEAIQEIYYSLGWADDEEDDE